MAGKTDARVLVVGGLVDVDGVEAEGACSEVEHPLARVCRQEGVLEVALVAVVLAPPGAQQHDHARLDLFGDRGDVLPGDLCPRSQPGGIDDDSRPDEAVDRHLVDAQPVFLEVIRRVDMSARLRAQVDGEQVEAVRLDGAVHLEPRGRVAGVHDRPGVHRHGQIDHPLNSHRQQLLHSSKPRAKVQTPSSCRCQEWS
jgi:hypothetical protein